MRFMSRSEMFLLLLLGDVRGESPTPEKVFFVGYSSLSGPIIDVLPTELSKATYTMAFTVILAHDC